MKIDEIKGKEVIDDQGNKLGEVSDVELDLMTRRVEGIVYREGGGVSAAVGMGKEMMVPCDRIDKIGDKVLLKRKGLSQHELDVITGGE